MSNDMNNVDVSVCENVCVSMLHMWLIAVLYKSHNWFFTTILKIVFVKEDSMQCWQVGSDSKGI